MASRKPLSRSDYTKRAKKLRSLGFDLHYNPNKKSLSSPHYKSAVSKAWHRAVYYVTNAEKNRIEFKRFKSAKAKRDWLGHVADETVMPGGVFIQRPKGIQRGSMRVRRGKKGTLYITSRTKGIRDVHIKLDITAVAIDPQKALEAALSGQKRPRELMLTSNGFDRTAGTFSDLEQFNRYLEEELVPRLEEKEFNFKKYGRKVFGVRLIYSLRRGKKAKGEGKTFDFSTGSIFDSSSKRVYGRKKIYSKKSVTKKKKRN